MTCERRLAKTFKLVSTHCYNFKTEYTQSETDWANSREHKTETELTIKLH